MRPLGCPAASPADRAPILVLIRPVGLAAANKTSRLYYFVLSGDILSSSLLMLMLTGEIIYIHKLGALKRGSPSRVASRNWQVF